MKDFKYQYSIKLEDGSIFVVHADTREELEDEIIYIKGLITNTPLNTVDKINKKIDEMREHTASEVSEDEGLCEEHQTIMKKNKNNKWFHMETKDGKVRFCNGNDFGWSEWK